MGKPNRKNVLRMASIVIALAMIVPGVILAQHSSADADMRSGPTTYAWVSFDSPGQASVLNDIGADIVSLRDTGAYVKLTHGQRNYLTHWHVSDMSERTMVNLFEQGISFDSQVGYDLPAEWRNPGTSEYLVQFVAPAESAWYEGVKAFSGKILAPIGDNLAVVKLNDNQRAKVENLDYVQWVGPYEPGFKMDKDIPLTGTVKLNIDAYDISDVPMIIDTLAGFSAYGIEDTHYGSVTCYVGASALPHIARMDTVKQVWNLPEMKKMNNVGGRIVQAHDVWVGEVSGLPFDITGSSQVIHIQDTGLDATHRDFTSGPLGDRILYRESGTDGDGHGTHCTGTAAGNGYNMEQYLGLDNMNRVYNELAATNPVDRPDRMGFAGRAPEAGITHNAGFQTNEWAAAYDTYDARAFSNSWGPISVDNTYSNAADNAMVTRPLGLILFAAGNDGPGSNTVSGNGNGKLAVGVGATENMRAIDFDSSDDYNQMVSFSSRGPVADGRVKPDVVEIGTAVYSTLSDDTGTTYFYSQLYDEVNIINVDGGDSLGEYVSFQGTSMACPAAAGDSILIRDYLHQVAGMTDAQIHANLLKTLLIHGAEDMGLGYPSFDQGWGRVNVRNSVAPAFPNVLQYYHHSAGIGTGTWDAGTQFDTEVIDNTVPLKITLVHWDTTTSGTLNYDLDLVVTSPTGTRYEGNAFNEAWSTPIANPAAWSTCAFPSWMGGNSYDWDTANDGGDDINNVEMFRVEYPEKGTWTVQVVYKSGSALPFSIAMTGGMDAASDANAAHYDYRVNLLLDIPRVVPERDDFGEGTFKGAPDGSVMVPFWVNNGGANDDTFTLTAPILPSGFTADFYPSSSVNVNAGKRLHGYARIMVGSGVAAGTYTLSFNAQSSGDSSKQSSIKFQVDVVTQKTPRTITIAGSSAHEAAPAFVSWSDGSTHYIACAYTKDDQFGERVYFTLSSNGGETWSTPQAISQPSWSPGYVDIARAPAGTTYAGRIMIAYSAWNPDGYNGRSDDTRCSYIKVHYANSPYSSWTEVNAYSLGEGPSAGNTYRTVNVEYVPSVNQFYIVPEVFGYTNTLDYQQNAIACRGKYSSNGGASWSALVQIDNGALTTKYYFFPNTEIDNLGNMVLYFYERDTGDTAQDRDATYRYYNGAWGTYRVAWDTTDNLMMPHTAITTQGTGNRAYGLYIKGPHTDGDRQWYLMYTDNPDAATPTFTTNVGPLADGMIISDHDYGTRFINDMQWSNGYLYVFGHQRMVYDDYGQPNMVVCYDNDFSTLNDDITDFLTLDSYVHGKEQATTTTHNGVQKVFVAQNVMTKNANHDIVGMHVYNGWKSEADTWGPTTEYISADKTVVNAGDIITIVANIQDWNSGGSDIRGAQYRTDVNPATWVNMQSFDGAFNSPSEAVISSTTKVNTAGWSSGLHQIWVRGQDNAPTQNWGAEEYIEIYVNPQVPAEATVTGPSGGDNQASQTITYTWEGIPTSVNLYRTTQPSAPYTWTLIGNENPVDGTRAYTFPATGTYGLKASAVGGLSTENSPPLSSEEPECWFAYDTTPPAAPTLNEVDQYGVWGSQHASTFYMRGVANEGSANGLTAYLLGETQSNTANDVLSGSGGTVYTGFRAWKRSTGGVETEITGGVSAIDTQAVNFEGISSQTWDCPQTALETTDSLVVRIYQDRNINPPTGLRATFTTPQLGATSIDASQWTLHYYVRRGINNDRFYWGTSTYDSRIEGVLWSDILPSTLHNTLNWTASSSPDVVEYNIYRSVGDSSAGPYELIDTVPVGTNTYQDVNKGTFDGTLWWYKVSAVDIATNEAESAPMQEGGGGDPPTPYDIAIPGTGWVFVSFPKDFSGAIQTVLNDPQTTWTVAKGWDNAAKQWLTYRASYATTLSTIDNTMGVWLYVTATDGTLTTSLSGYYPASAVNIELKAGWNMVGYPSATNRLASTTLPAQATMVSVWQAATPYINDQAPTAVTMSHGNAYWVYVTADCTWAVQP